MTAELVPAEVLAYHGLKPDDRMAGLMILLGERYQLDPLAGHLEVIKTRSGPRLYITRDGYVALGHRSGQLDGIVVEDLHHGETGWSATVSVWRKDMRFPFTYSAGCGDQEPQAAQGDGDAMALARAERRALRRAFPVIAALENEHGLGGSGAEAAVEPDGEPPLQEVTKAAIREQLAAEQALTPASTRERMLDGAQLADLNEAGAELRAHFAGSRPDEWQPSNADQAEAHRAVANMKVDDRNAFLKRHGIDDFGSSWSATAVADILAGPADAAVDTCGPAGPASS